MRSLFLLSILIVIACLLSGCAFFKRDIKTTDEAADAGGALIAQEDSAFETGPSKGVVGLEKAPHESFQWSETKGVPSNNPIAGASDSLSLPPRHPSEPTIPPDNGSGTDIWTSSESGNSLGGAGGELSAPPIAGPAIDPAPSGKPLTGTPFASPQEPSTQTMPLRDSPQELDSLTLRSTPPPPSAIVGPPILGETSPSGFQTITDDASEFAVTTPPPFPRTSSLDDLTRETDRQAADLARAIRPSGLNEPLAATKPEDSSMPSRFHSISPSADPLTQDVGPSTTEIPPPGRQRENLLVTEGNTRSDSSVGTNPAPSVDAATLKQRGTAQYKQKQFDEAARIFKQYLSAYPDEDQEIQWRLAQSLYEGNRWGEAEKEFNKLRGSPRREFRADAILKLGMIDQKRGDKDKAREHWRQVVESYPKTEAAARASRFLTESP